MKTFLLNGPEAYQALCVRSDQPWIPNGALPREPRWGHQSDPLAMTCEGADGQEALEAARAWLAHVEAGRIGGE